MLLKNYITICSRIFKSDWLYGVLNMVGLIVGITSTLLLSAYLFTELTYERYHENSDQIYRVVQNLNQNESVLNCAISASALGVALDKDYEQIENYSTLIKHRDFYFYDKEDKKLPPIESVFFVESNVFDVFSYKLLEGNAKTALEAPFSIVINESISKEKFGDENPVGKEVKFSDGKLGIITGVMEDFDHNSHFNAKVFISLITMDSIYNVKMADNWGSFDHTYNYLQLQEGVNALELTGEINGRVDDYMIDHYKGKVKFELQPINDIHLKSDIMWEIHPNGHIEYIYGFIVAGFFLLFISSINYMNLAIARSLRRRLEVGVRKVCGATRGQLRSQFLYESLLYTAFALLLSILLALILLPHFSELIAVELSAASWLEPELFLSLIAIMIILGVASGAYPGLIMNRFEPIHIFTDATAINQNKKSRASALKTLLAIQLSISLALIITSGIIADQLDFLNNHDLGFERENVVLLEIENRLRYKRPDLIEAFEKFPEVVVVGSSSFSVSDHSSADIFKFESGDSIMHLSVNANAVSHQFVPALKMQVVEGRNFKDIYEESQGSAVLVNETMVEIMRWRENGGKVLGRKVGMPFRKDMSAKVIGVVKDFHVFSLHDKVKPSIMVNWAHKNNILYVKTKAGTDVKNLLAKLKVEHDKIIPGSYFKYSFLEEELEKNYKNDRTKNTILGYISSLLIFLTCIGIFAIVSYSSIAKTKEIGIRKVLGADAGEILVLLSKEFIWMSLLAGLIGIPLGGFIGIRWLQDYAYQIELSFSYYLIPMFFLATIVFLTIIYHVMTLVKLNPVTALNDRR